MLRRTFSLILLIFTSCSHAVSVTHVRNQLEFDHVVDSINAGKRISIELAQGTYVLTTDIQAKASFTITGNNSTIRRIREEYSLTEAIRVDGAYYVCKLKQPIGFFPLFTNAEGKQLSVSEAVDAETLVNKTTDDIVGTYAPNNGIEIKIPLTDNLRHLRNKSFPIGYGYFDCGWSRVLFKVLRADSRYFYCVTLDYANVKNFNYDLSHYKKPLRYVLYNVEKDEKGIFYDKEYIYIPKNQKTVYLLDELGGTKVDIKSTSDFVMSGVTLENVAVSVKQKADNVCEIRNCKFMNTLGNALIINKKNYSSTRSAVIDNCQFTDCALLFDYQVVLKTSLNANNCITMSGCTVSRYPETNLIYKNCMGSVFADGDITLTGNTVFNTCRNHLRLRSGCIQCNDNILYNTVAFNAKVDRNLSSDYGMIYINNIFYDSPEKVLTNKESVATIEGNLIHGAHAYQGNARGIMIDDGRGDVTCTHNVIYDTQMYSIDARYEKKFTGISSVRVKLAENLLSTPYRLETDDSGLGQNAPISSGNVLLSRKANKTRNIIQESQDMRLENVRIWSHKSNSTTATDRRGLSELKRTAIWKDVRKFGFSISEPE